MKAYAEFEVYEREIVDGEAKPYDSPTVEAYVKPIRALSTAGKYEIVLVDFRGQVRQHAIGTDRKGCILALESFGFQVKE